MSGTGEFGDIAQRLARNPLGIIENGAIAIEAGRILRVGKRTEMAGFRAKEILPLGGAWVTPGLVDCHTQLIFGGKPSIPTYGGR